MAIRPGGSCADRAAIVQPVQIRRLLDTDKLHQLGDMRMENLKQTGEEATIGSDRLIWPAKRSEGCTEGCI